MNGQVVYHPKPNDKGEQVAIHSPSMASERGTWLDPTAIAVGVPCGTITSTLNGLPLDALQANEADFARLVMAREFVESEFPCPMGLEPAAGAAVVERDGRVWLVHPTNPTGGYACTFPTGGLGGLKPREAALRAVYEASGLLVEPFGFLVDVRRAKTFTRYYLAQRIAGSPAEMGYKSQAVSLVPMAQLISRLASPADHAIVHALFERQGDWRDWCIGSYAGQD